MFSETILYRNSTDSSNTKYVLNGYSSAGSLLKDSNVMNGVSVPDQPTPIEEYEGNIATSVKVFGKPTFEITAQKEMPYVDPSGTYLAPMELAPKMTFKKTPDGWPVGKKVRADAEFEMATSTKINEAYDTSFQIDIGSLLADATILMAAVSQTSAYSKRVIMTLAGVLKPIVGNNTVTFKMKILHANRPTDGYDSLTAVATLTIKSALINWYFRPRDYVSQAVEEASQRARLNVVEQPKRRKYFRFLRAMLSPLRSNHT